MIKLLLTLNFFFAPVYGAGSASDTRILVTDSQYRLIVDAYTDMVKRPLLKMKHQLKCQKKPKCIDKVLINEKKLDANRSADRTALVAQAQKEIESEFSTAEIRLLKKIYLHPTLVKFFKIVNLSKAREIQSFNFSQQLSKPDIQSSFSNAEIQLLKKMAANVTFSKYQKFLSAENRLKAAQTKRDLFFAEMGNPADN